MPTTRRDFLKHTALAGAAAALPYSPQHSLAEQSANAAAAVPPGEPQAGAGYTRGIGIYPGDPDEDFSPELLLDTATYRNLALRRPAFHSSSYDYNLTAQLVTDGIKDTKLPVWVATSVSGRGVLPKTEREIFFDHFRTSTYELHGPDPTVQIELGGPAEDLPTVDRLDVFVAVPIHADTAPLLVTASTSDDGRLWTELGTASGMQPLSPTNFPPDLVRTSQLLAPSIPLRQPCRSRFYRIRCSVRGAPGDAAQAIAWGVGQIAFYHGATRVQVGGPYSFTSAWKSGGSGEEWVYVDLGARCDFDRIALHWIAPPSAGRLQVSDDARNWRDLRSLSPGAPVDELRLSPPAQGRYVRALLTQPATPHGYILSELEVYGRGGPVAHARPGPAPGPDRRLELAGGRWRIERSTLVSAGGEALSGAGFNDATWLVATVPGTVLTSYVNAGAIADPNYGDNQLAISDSFFCADFWYRNEFDAPHISGGELAWLHFDGVNWKATVYLNGQKLGHIDGGFTRARFDVTAKLLHDRPNALAVLIEKNATPGSTKQKTLQTPGKNGGALGADNPTYHASIGWDWIPTIRGRNTGIWGPVSLHVTGPVTIESPFVNATLPLPDTSRADLTVEVTLLNHRAKPVRGILRGRIGGPSGAIAFDQRVVLGASARSTLKLTSATHPALRLDHPTLWWPAGYGDPHLYDVELHFEAEDGNVLDRAAFKTGIRQMTFSEDGGRLRLWINGRRFIAKGGNWGFGESMLRYRAREFDTAVRYHREMNFTMIRNWVGQIGDDAFFEACDRHGIVVWQDFWLANPWDGPIPEDNTLFLDNARDFVSRIRNHPSIGLYCGRNEGFPPKPLEEGLRRLLDELHPSLHYIPSSADDVVSGHGPYLALPPAFYFESADAKLHSEIGMPTIPPIESVRAMMPESSLWPQNLDWGLHDFCLEGAQGGAAFRMIVDESYGGADTADGWITLAQFVNYEGYRAIFEAQSRYRMGLLLWMSHPCWPSFVWQTYDYYFEPTSAYFACKKASEPVHIQWNRTTESVEVVNYHAGNLQGLTARVEVFNLDGAPQWNKSAALDSPEDSVASPIRMEYPANLTAVHLLRLTLSRGGEVLSANDYLRGTIEGDYRAIRLLPEAHVRATTGAVRHGDEWLLTTTVENTSSTPALMARLKAVRERSGDRILPAIYSDNYLTLLPGERRTVTTTLKHRDTRGENPRIVVSGFNVSGSNVSAGEPA